MSETCAVYIPCASGISAFTDCVVEKRGDLIRLLGHSMMDFTPVDARRLALHILELLGESACLVPPLDHEPASSSGDPVVDDIRERLLQRSRAGQLKYGKTLARDDLSLTDWLKHQRDELLDGALYAEATIRRLFVFEDDRK
jgi:hypothetical protein